MRISLVSRGVSAESSLTTPYRFAVTVVKKSSRKVARAAGEVVGLRVVRIEQSLHEPFFCGERVIGVEENLVFLELCGNAVRRLLEAIVARTGDGISTVGEFQLQVIDRHRIDIRSVASYLYAADGR